MAISRNSRISLEIPMPVGDGFPVLHWCRCPFAVPGIFRPLHTLRRCCICHRQRSPRSPDSHLRFESDRYKE